MRKPRQSQSDYWQWYIIESYYYICVNCNAAFWKTIDKSVRECRLTPNEQIFSYIIAEMIKMSAMYKT